MTDHSQMVHLNCLVRHHSVTPAVKPLFEFPQPTLTLTPSLNLNLTLILGSRGDARHIRKVIIRLLCDPGGVVLGPLFPDHVNAINPALIKSSHPNPDRGSDRGPNPNLMAPLC